MTRGTAIKTALKVLAVVAVVGLLYLLVRRVGVANILRAVRESDKECIRSAVLLQFTVFVLWCFRWLHIMRPKGRQNMATVFPIYMAGVFFNVLTPGARVGGEPVRAYYMSRAFGGEKTAYLGTILADKVVYGTVFFCFLVASVFFVVAFVPIALFYKAAMAGIVGLVLLAVLSGFLLREQIGVRSRLLGRLLPTIYNGRLLKFLRERFHTYEHFEEYAIQKLENLVAPFSRAAGSPKSLALIIGISAVSWLLVCLAHLVLFHGFGADIGFLRVLVIVTISTFFGDISMSPGGAGFMEAAMLGLCAAFGVEQSTAAAVTFLSRGIFYGIGLGLGGLSLVGLAGVYGWRKDDVKESSGVG